MTMETVTGMTIEPDKLLLLLNWTSPAFPSGAFAYSHGLEWAIADGDVRDGPSLEAWIGDLLMFGSGWNDAVLIANTSADTLAEINALALALPASLERYRETTALGRNFTEAVSAAMPLPFAEAAEAIAYPVALAEAGLRAGIPLEPLVVAYLQGLAATLTSVAVRLVPIGQKAGLAVLASLMPLLLTTAKRAVASDLDDLGGAAFRADLASLHHAQQQPRIFRT